MDRSATSRADGGAELLELYDAALASVYGYLRRRCGSDEVAEDLTSETFLAAVDAVRRDAVADLTIAWLVGVARHKLVDHWRRAERESRKLALVESDPIAGGTERDGWDVELDRIVAEQAMADLGGHHRAALTLRYLDGLPVAEVAAHMGRTVGATEVLLVRARRAFRDRYEATAGSTDRSAAPTGEDEQ